MSVIRVNLSSLMLMCQVLHCEMDLRWAQSESVLLHLMMLIVVIASFLQGIFPEREIFPSEYSLT